MHRPRMTWVPDEFFMDTLHLSILKDMWVVNQVWNCRGFDMRLAHAREYSWLTAFLYSDE